MKLLLIILISICSLTTIAQGTAKNDVKTDSAKEIVPFTDSSVVILQLPLAAVQYIYTALQEKPFKDVSPLLQSIIFQIQEQQKRNFKKK